MRVPALLCLSLALNGEPVWAQDAEPPEAVTERPRIALVLSGGGARGAAHAGVLQLLENHRVPVDIIVGTSFGALVAGFYAAGLSPEEIVEWIEVLDWNQAASDRPLRRVLSIRRKQDDHNFPLQLQIGYRDGRFILPKGIVGAHILGFMLRVRTLHTARWGDFDDFPIRLRTVATDIERGEAVVLSRGPLADAILASMAVPGVVAPMEIDGRLLLDGGLVDNLSVGVARALGADIIIAVDVTTPLAPRSELEDFVGVSAQVINMMGQENLQLALAMLDKDDILVRPDVSGIDATDFDMMGEAIQRGLAAQPVIAGRLRALSLDPDAWGEWLAGHRVADRRLPVLDFVDIDNPTPIADELIRSRLRLEPGTQLSIQTLQRDLDSLYSIGEFERIDFELVERDGAQGIRLSVTPNQVGPSYLRFGFNIQDDLQGGGAYNLLLMHTRTQLNRRNGEWRTEAQFGETRRLATEWYQPLTWRGGFFIRPRAEWMSTNFYLYDADGTRTAQYKLGRTSFALDLGFQWDNIGEFVVGPFSQDVDAIPSIGAPLLPRFGERVAGWQLRLTVDQLDAWNFPSDGWFLELVGRRVDDSFGGDRDFSRVSGKILHVWPVTTRDRLAWSTEVGAKTGGDLPLYEEFPIGGFLSLSGLRRDSLRGAYMFSTRLIWYRSVYRMPVALGRNVYVGLSHERGNVWDTRGEVNLGDLRWGASAFIGADFNIGALYFGLGYADNRRSAGYLFLQRSF